MLLMLLFVATWASGFACGQLAEFFRAQRKMSKEILSASKKDVRDA